MEAVDSSLWLNPWRANVGHTLMTTTKELPSTLATMIDTALGPGEHVVWTSRPRMTESAIGTLIAAVLGIGVWVAFCFTDFGPDAGIGRVIFLYATFVGWVIPFPLVFFCRSWAFRNTCYVITNRRAIAFVPHWRRGYRLFVNLPEDLASVRPGTFRKSFGSIVWVEKTSSQFSWLVGRYRGAFTAIDNPREVLEMMYDAFLPLLASRLKDPNPDVRRKAASSLAKIGASAKQAVPHLVAALESDDSVVRGRAAYALGLFGSRAKPAIPALRRRLLADESREVAETARKAIDKIESEKEADPICRNGPDGAHTNEVRAPENSRTPPACG